MQSSYENNTFFTYKSFQNFNVVTTCKFCICNKCILGIFTQFKYLQYMRKLYSNLVSFSLLLLDLVLICPSHYSCQTWYYFSHHKGNNLFQKGTKTYNIRRKSGMYRRSIRDNAPLMPSYCNWLKWLFWIKLIYLIHQHISVKNISKFYFFQFYYILYICNRINCTP